MTSPTSNQEVSHNKLHYIIFLMTSSSICGNTREIKILQSRYCVENCLNYKQHDSQVNTTTTDKRKGDDIHGRCAERWDLVASE